MGVSNNIDLSSRRAANIAAYFRSQGVNPNILSAKGIRRSAPDSAERYAAEPGSESTH
jgi:outer membrane protein OmpA-like peptidoglycan-associated protein